MIVYEAWPPEPGKMHFSPRVRRHFEAPGVDHGFFRTLGHFAGIQLAENMKEPTIESITACLDGLTAGASYQVGAHLFIESALETARQTVSGSADEVRV